MDDHGALLPCFCEGWRSTEPSFLYLFIYNLFTYVHVGSMNWQVYKIKINGLIFQDSGTCLEHSESENKNDKFVSALTYNWYGVTWCSILYCFMTRSEYTDPALASRFLLCSWNKRCIVVGKWNRDLNRFQPSRLVFVQYGFAPVKLRMEMAARLVRLPDMSRCPTLLHSGRLMDINMSIKMYVCSRMCLIPGLQDEES